MIVRPASAMRAVAVSGCLLLSGCVVPSEQADLLDLGQTDGSACVYDSESRIGSFGTTVTNTSDQVIDFQAVGLVEADGLEVAGSAVMRFASDFDGLGAAHGWPPTMDALRDSWSERQPVRGFELAPGEKVELLVGLEAPSGEGSTRALDLEYTDESGATYRQQNVDRLGVTDGPVSFCEELAD
jgi:hypothetical protein